MPITVKRVSDGQVHKFDAINPASTVKSLKEALRKDFKPKTEKGCRLKNGKKVLKSRNTLKHYDIQDGATIEMDDRKNWSDSSSSSSSAS